MRRLLCAQGRLPGRARGLGGTLLSARLPGWQPEHVDSSLLPAPPYQLGHLEPMPPQVWGAAAASQEGAAPPRPIRAARLARTAAGRGPRGPPFSPPGPPAREAAPRQVLGGVSPATAGEPSPPSLALGTVRASGCGGCREPRPRLTFVGVGEPDLGGGRVGAAVRLLRGGGGGAAGVCRGRGAQATGEETAHEGGGRGAPHQAAAGCGYRGESQSGQAWRPHQGALRRGPSGPEPPKLPSSGTQDAEARAAGHSDT